MLINKIYLRFPSVSINEAFARSVIATFLLPLDPTIQELADIKTAVSEAVTNCIIHGYKEKQGDIVLEAKLHDDGLIEIIIEDEGVGIEDLSLALSPMYTSAPHLERSGMGFTIMEQFMDFLEVKSEVGKGTKVKMLKRLEPHRNM